MTPAVELLLLLLFIATQVLTHAYVAFIVVLFVVVLLFEVLLLDPVVCFLTASFSGGVEIWRK